MTTEVEKEDINRLHDRLDEAAKERKETNKLLGELSISVATIGTKIKERPRPCLEHNQLRKEHDNHISEHNDTKKTLKTAIIRKIVDLVAVGVAGAFCLWLGTKVGR